MVHLNEFYEKYKDKGLILLSVTNEPRGLVDAFVTKNSPKYPIVIESSDSLKNVGGDSFPTSFLIGPDGKVASADFHAGSDPSILDSLFAKQSFAPKLPDKLAAATKLMDKQKYADARKTLETLAAGRVTEDEKKAAEDAIKWIDDSGPVRLASAAEDEKAGNYGDAAETYDDVVENYSGLDAATKAADALKALTADPAKKKEVDGSRALAKAMADASGMNSEKKKIPLFKSVVSRFKDTKAGAKAAKILADLEAKENKGGK